MRKRLSLGVVILLVLSLCISACSAVKEYKNNDDFEDKTDDFTMRLLWQDFIGTSLHFDDELREEFLERFEDWDAFRVTEVKLSRAESEIDGEVERKIAYYNIEYYLLTEMKVRKEKVKLIWELPIETEDKASFWRIINSFPQLEVEKK